MEKKNPREEVRRTAEEKKRKKEERLAVKRKLEEKWAMMRWIVNYIDENR